MSRTSLAASRRAFDQYSNESWICDDGFHEAERVCRISHVFEGNGWLVVVQCPDKDKFPILESLSRLLCPSFLSDVLCRWELKACTMLYFRIDPFHGGRRAYDVWPVILSGEVKTDVLRLQKIWILVLTGDFHWIHDRNWSGDVSWLQKMWTLVLTVETPTGFY